MADFDEERIEDSPPATPPVEAQSSGASDGEKAHVKEWLERIRMAEKHHGPAFKRMRKCMDIVALGGNKEWVDSNKYVVPLIARHINLAVAQLYAKNPKAGVKRRRRLMYTVWDGNVETLARTAQQAQLGDPMAFQQFVAMAQDIQAVEQYERMATGAAKTMEILWDYVLDEQAMGTKKQIKKLVRRAKTTGVGYVKMDFQREYEPTADRDSRLDDMTMNISRLQQLQREFSRGDLREEDPAFAEMQTLERNVQKVQPALLREGLVLAYPRSTRIIPDPACYDLKTMAGAGWLAELIYMTPREIEEVYGAKIDSEYTKGVAALEYQSDTTKRKGACRVFEVQDRDTGSFFTVCEGYDGYLKHPDVPPVFVERFFTIFPLVFNEIEHEEELFPPSDVWRARHMQDEYNRSREALREHRIAARPYFMVRAGMLEGDEKKRLSNHAAHEVVELVGMPDNQAVEQVLMRGPTAPLDPNLYQVEEVNNDILRTVGAQEANLGGLSGATATESSIAEGSRTSSIADNVDDLDELLSDLARSGGQVLLVEMSKETVIEIVGPGAIWPDAPETREQLVKELVLEIKAGSSGRPNRAARIADLERAAPFLIQLPGVSAKPMANEYAELLDIEPDELYREGALSIVAQNQMMGGSLPPTAGGPVPAAQGGQGGSRTGPGPQQAQGPQAARPTPSASEAPAQN